MRPGMRDGTVRRWVCSTLLLVMCAATPLAHADTALVTVPPHWIQEDPWLMRDLPSVVNHRSESWSLGRTPHGRDLAMHCYWFQLSDEQHEAAKQLDAALSTVPKHWWANGHERWTLSSRPSPLLDYSVCYLDGGNDPLAAMKASVKSFPLLARYQPVFAQLGAPTLVEETFIQDGTVNAKLVFLRPSDLEAGGKALEQVGFTGDPTRGWSASAATGPKAIAEIDSDAGQDILVILVLAPAP